MTHAKIDRVAPAFELPATTGGTIASWEFKARRPLVLFFPHAHSAACHDFLQRLAVELPRYDEYQAQLLALVRNGDLRLPVDTVAAPSIEAAAGEVVPVSAIAEDRMGLDIGPATVAAFAAAIRESRTVVWNGPMGVFERAPWAAGTIGVARAVAEAPGLTVVGGGDTVAAVEQAGVARRIGYLSTGGGAFLEYLEGRTLPGVAALDDR